MSLIRRTESVGLRGAGESVVEDCVIGMPDEAVGTGEQKRREQGCRHDGPYRREPKCRYVRACE